MQSMMRADAGATCAADETTSNGQRAVVVITDGFPVGDVVSLKPSSSERTLPTPRVRRHDAFLHARAGFGENDATATPLDVSGLVEKTGGRSVYADQNDLGPLFSRIAED